ncbi:DNA topoisomerase III [Limnohabitans sp.]|uniref:DNA topoisomerase III n=1 Tax=Limnohabitans sp. TaxID=1907725 RepID=UPI00286F9567|nr:DNA topoisomerase III [Limnohabitans sp.]
MRLFICEKPSQAKDIAKFVGATQRGNGCTSGPDVAVTWCIGHLLEQSPPEHYNPELKSWNIDLLPVVPQQWHMAIKSSTREQYQCVAKALKQATEVIIATDADREGEVIAREVLTLNGYRGPVKRLWLSAFDDASVRKALGKLMPGEKTLPMYFSGMGRSRADWLAGMNLTMALTKAFGTGGRDGVLHCGRVQTPVLGLIVRRERAIANFKPKTHFVLKTSFEIQGSMVPMVWLVSKDKLDADGHCIDQAYVKSVAAKVLHKTGRLTDVETTRERKLAPLLYSLGSLQREASARYGLKAQAVLDACQALYEKHKATTYPRSDCEYLPLSMHGDAQSVLQAVAKIDSSLSKLTQLADLSKPGRVYNDTKVTAHHAIIPTGNAHVRMADMSKTEVLIYDLIRRRFIAQFLGAFEYNQTVIKLVCEAERFEAKGKIPLVQGWQLAYEGMEQFKTKPSKSKKYDDEGNEVEDQEVSLPSCQVGMQGINRLADVATEKTKPPKRYTEGTLLGAMESIDKVIEDPRLKKIMQTKEKAGIGTDATRSAIIEGLFKRSYIANEGKAIVPTDKGMHLIELMEKVAPEMADPVLTALWEDQLGQIESGTVTLEQFERNLGTWLAKLIERIKVQAKAMPQRPDSRPTSSTNANGSPVDANSPVYACKACGKALKLRQGPSSAFWGCSGYPTCKTTLPDANGKPGERAQQSLPAEKSIPNSGKNSTAVVCDACGKPMKLRQGGRGPFYGCSGYPDCKNTKPV